MISSQNENPEVYKKAVRYYSSILRKTDLPLSDITKLERTLKQKVENKLEDPKTVPIWSYEMEAYEEQQAINGQGN